MAVFHTGISTALILLALAAGCADHLSAGRITPDQVQGLRLYEENSKRPAIGMLIDADIQTLLNDNAAPAGQADGLVFGIVDDHGSRMFAAGTLGDNTRRKVDGDTPFKIGSITKVFTAILLQDMVDHGQMKLDDPVQKYLPASVKMPTRNGKQITLFDLAIHTSGLPRDGGGNDVEHLYAFLSACRLSRDPGTQYEYSNLGVGLLGHVISLKAGKAYETLVLERICNPLGMDSTRITLTADLRTCAARGHAFPGCPVDDGEWHGPLEGCGALYSTANDLLKFVAADAGITPSPLTPLLQRAWAVHKLPSGRSGRLVWMDDGDIICHGGNTNGFTSDIAFDPATRRGIVSLANVTCCRIRSVWKPLLNQQSYRPAHTTTLSPKLLDHYVGTYRYADDSACVVRREGDRLLFQWWHGRSGRPVASKSSNWTGPSQSWLKKTPVERGKPSRRTHGRLYHTNHYVGQYRHLLLGLIPVGPKLNIYASTDQLGTHLIGYVSDSDHGELYPASESTFINPDLDGTWLTFSRRRTENSNDVSAAHISAHTSHLYVHLV